MSQNTREFAPNSALQAMLDSRQPANPVAEELAALRKEDDKAGGEVFGTYVERNDGTAEFRRTGEPHSPTAHGYKFWNLYSRPQPQADQPAGRVALIKADSAIVEENATRLCTTKYDHPATFILGWRASEAFHGITAKDQS